MPTWPTTLPQTPLMEGYSESPADIVTRTDMEAAVPLTRRRYTAGLLNIQCRVRLTKPQTLTLDSFHQTDCAGGAISFDWLHPRTKVASRFRFGEPPAYSADQGYYVAQLVLELLPAIAAYQAVTLVRAAPDRLVPCVPADRDLAEICRGLLCTTSGTVRVTAAGSPDGTSASVPMTAGPVRLDQHIKRVWATGTTGAYQLVY